MLASIMDCEALLARGMAGGVPGTANSPYQADCDDIPSIEDAVRAYIQGDIVDHTEKLH